MHEHRGPGAAHPEQPGRGVAEHHVVVREAVWIRPEPVALEEVERLVDERVAEPRHLPGIEERVAVLAGHVATEVEGERPRHGDREHDAEDDRQPRP